MENETKILYATDAPDDVTRVLQLLKDFDPSIACVATEGEFMAHIGSGKWDLIFSGIGNQGLDGFAALTIVRGRSLDIPLIFIAADHGTRIAIQAFQMGANDYVLKDQVEMDLLPAVKRALEKAKALPDMIAICSWCKKIRENGEDESKQKWTKPDQYFAARLGLKFTHGICPNCKTGLDPVC